MEEAGKIKIVGWADMQNYKDRRPPWIKLHRDLLEDRRYRSLDDFVARLLIDLWLLATDDCDPQAGCITYDTAEIAWRLHLPDESRVEAALRKLVSAGFITTSGTNASDTLAKCLQLAIPETETETETEKSQRQNAKPKKSKTNPQPTPEFMQIWDIYPSRVQRADAFEEYRAAIRSGALHVDILAGVKRYADWVSALSDRNGDDPPRVMHFHRWLKRQRWTDEYPMPAAQRDPLDALIEGGGND